MSETNFTRADKTSLEQRGIPLAEAERQFARLQRGEAFIALERPCTIGDGIRRLDSDATLKCCRAFARNRQRFTRFVPASGAATRMFQGLFPGETDAVLVARLRDNLDRFPFASELTTLTGGDPRQLTDQELLSHLLLPEGLGLAGMPKGLLPLHRGKDYNRTAFAEHLFESHRIGIDRFHFTVSPEHLALFEQELAQVKTGLGPGADLDVSFSLQAPHTDTIALDVCSNTPFHEESGELLFRPAGHGALLTNLEQSHGDLILIRNIDNVVPKPSQEAYQFWTEVLGGLLIDLQQQAFAWIDNLERDPSVVNCTAAAAFIGDTFGRRVKSGASARELVDLLDRPIRIGGMVPVSGQPGGGPFWCRDAIGHVSPQIVEGVQIDPNDADQQGILATSTHFNPVNLACTLRDHHGNPYRLDDFIDADAALITAKSHTGRNLLALERPGLWNGAMSGWNSLFIELPPETFNPIKTVFDLLLPAHQVNA